MRDAIVVTGLYLLIGCAGCASQSDADDMNSNIKSDETVVFFRTSGWLDRASREWHLPVHGWIYEPEDSTARKATFAEILEGRFDLTVTEKNESNFSRRINLLMADNERGKRIVINIAGRNHALPKSAENGHFAETIVIPAADAEKYSENGYIHYRAVTDDAETREFSGSVGLVEPDGLSIISDIDDTVKVSNVTDRRSLLEHTFLLDFVAAPGMPELYRDWSIEGTAFHFVSSSPWQLYEPLKEFLDQAGFPWASFSLKAVRFRDETLLDLFKEGTETKPPVIEAILDRYPERKFILIGDSGEQDPEVYAALLRERPDQILKILIRNVTSADEDSARFESEFAGIDTDRWQLFQDPNSLIFPDDR